MENVEYRLINKETGQPFKVVGDQKVAGRKFVAIEGGFGEGKKSMLVRDIAMAHGREVKLVNQLINNNINRFKNGVDILNILGNSELLEALNIRIQHNTKSVFLLSERGYTKLLKIMDDDLAWELHDQIVDEYFNMRAEIKQPQQLTQWEMMKVMFNEVDEQKVKIKKLEENHEKVQEDIVELKDNSPMFPAECKAISDAVRRRGVALMNGKESNTYRDKNLRGRVYQSLYKQLRDEFGVGSYQAIKRKYHEKALVIVEEVKLPFHLTEEIQNKNNQMTLI